MAKHDIDLIADRMYASLYQGNPTLPPPIPFEELDPVDAEKFRTMARAAAELIDAGA